MARVQYPSHFPFDMKKIAYTLFILSCFACGAVWDAEQSLEFISSKTLLEENLKPISPIKSFDILEDESMIAITENQQIVRYSKAGEQVKILDFSGQGEFELVAPGDVEAFGNGYVIWDENALKMVEFNEFDQGIKEYKGFDHAIKGFEVSEQYFYTYISPLPNEPFIQIYDKESEQILHRMGAATNSDIIANLYKCGGGMTFFEGDFVFISSANLDIFRVFSENVENIQVSILDVKGLEFNKLKEDPMDIINFNRSEAFQLSMASSIITGIYSVGGNLIVTGETGKADFNGHEVDINKRKQFFLSLNDDLKVEGLDFKPVDFNAPCKLWKDSGGYIYRIIKREGKDEYEYFLEKLTLSN